MVLATIGILFFGIFSYLNITNLYGEYIAGNDIGDVGLYFDAYLNKRLIIGEDLGYVVFLGLLGEYLGPDFLIAYGIFQSTAPIIASYIFISKLKPKNRRNI